MLLVMRCVLEGIPLLLGAGARAAVRASAGIAGTPRGYISASHVPTRSSVMIGLFCCLLACSLSSVAARPVRFCAVQAVLYAQLFDSFSC